MAGDTVVYSGDMGKIVCVVYQVAGNKVWLTGLNSHDEIDIVTNTSKITKIAASAAEVILALKKIGL